jgi:hypothetical protein
LIISTNPSIYGSQEYNETLEYKYATPEEKLQLEFQNLESDCLVSRGGLLDYAIILMLDKCKPIVEHLEKKGWRVDTIGQTPLNDLNDIKEDLIYLVFGIELPKHTCVTEMFEWHVLLKDNDNCQNVVQNYLGNGWNLVDKYDEKWN